MMPPRTSWYPLLLVVVALAAASCAKKATPLVSSAAAGGTLRVSLTHVDQYRNLRAVVGGQPVPVRAARPAQVDVLIPLLDPGPADVVLLDGNRELARFSITVTDSPTRRLAFTIARGKVELIRTSRSADAPTANVRSNGIRLSFDLINAKGGLVYSGSIADPTAEGGETFMLPDSSGVAGVGHVAAPDSTAFLLDIPTPPSGTLLRLFRVPPGLDITTPEGRDQRKLIREWQL